MKRKKIVYFFIIAVMFLLSSCAAISDSQVDIDELTNRLASVDEFKKTVPSPTPISIAESTALSFRGVPYGATMSDVSNAETLALVDTYSNALDFASTDMFSYSMQTTYWFNEAGQFYSASYYLLSDTFLSTLQNIEAGLTAEYGDPMDDTYYDMNGSIVSFASDTEAQSALDSQDAYYFLGYSDADTGLIIAVYVEGTDTGYQFNIYYTDPAYLD